MINQEFILNKVNKDWISIFNREINKKYFKFIIDELETCNKKNILLTGGAGFVGSNLIKLLLQKSKYNVISLDNYSSGSKKTISKVQE